MQSASSTSLPSPVDFAPSKSESSEGTLQTNLETVCICHIIYVQPRHTLVKASWHYEQAQESTQDLEIRKKCLFNAR